MTSFALVSNLVRDLIQFRHGIDRRLLHLDQPIGLTNKTKRGQSREWQAVLMGINNAGSPPIHRGGIHETSLDLDLRLDFTVDQSLYWEF